MSIQIKDCPRCGEPIPNREHAGQYSGAISRHDNVTEICSDCGTNEAIEDLEKQSAWTVLREWHDSLDNAVRDDKRELMNFNPHMWWQYLGLRNAISKVAQVERGEDWVQENTKKRDQLTQ